MSSKHESIVIIIGTVVLGPSCWEGGWEDEDGKILSKLIAGVGEERCSLLIPGGLPAAEKYY